MTTPYNLEALMAKAREGQIVSRPKPAPCLTWCDMEHLAQRTYQGAMGHCTCTEACEWEQCPMNEEAWVPPAVPRFREDAA